MKPFVIIFWILSVFFHPGILNQEVQLEEVGITVQLSDSWELQQATVGSPEHRYPASNYIIDVSVEDTANAVFNELWVQRFDYFEKRDLVKWHRGRYSLENLAVEKLGRRIELPVPHPEFEEMAIYEFEEIRGEERLKKTQGWVVFATHGQSAFFIRIGTIKSEYPKSHALIKDILYSIRVNAV